MIDYTVLYKSVLPPVEDTWPSDARWDFFISAYTEADRVKRVFDKVSARSKYWLIFPEYGFRNDEFPDGQTFAGDTRHEGEYLARFWDHLGMTDTNASICIDITGFIRPYLIFLVRWLMEKGITVFDAIYSEPIRYAEGEQTEFSGKTVTEVRQVAGFEGEHETDTSNDVLILGSGYDDQLIAHAAKSKNNAHKVQVFGFPSLRADMYQENVLRVQLAEESVGSRTGDQANCFYAPANDPFVTAHVLREIVSELESRKRITNLYLCPLSTKPMVLGFTLYYITERRNGPTSIVFPFSTSYARETSKGISRIWKYTVELPRT